MRFLGCDMRRLLTAGAMTLTCLSCTPAFAAEPTPLPPLPPLPSCQSTVDGQPGQQVTLAPTAVADPVAKALSGVDPLGLLAAPFRATWGAMPPIPLGAVPAGQGAITGDQIADAVTARLGQIPLLGPVLPSLTPAVRGVVAPLCGIVTRGALPVVAPPPAAANPPASRPGGPGGPGDPAVSGSPYPQTWAPSRKNPRPASARSSVHAFRTDYSAGHCSRCTDPEFRASCRTIQRRPPQ